MAFNQYIYDTVLPCVELFFSQYIKYMLNRLTNEHAITHMEILDISEQDKILFFTTEFLKKYGFNCKSRDKYTEDDFLIEFHKYNLFEKEILESNLCRHIDDETGLRAKVNTFIYYIEKTETIDGGDLIMFLEKGDEKIKIKSNTFLMMRGDIEHEITPLSGTGVRTCIVVQIPRLE
jgi:hypothetical protein